MLPLEIPFPNIDPVAISLGPIAVKWYGLAYMAGLILGWLYIRGLLRQTGLWARETPPFDPGRVDDLLVYMAIGVIAGGRLGYILFYEPSTYLNNPIEIVQVWKGGMAFHGALLATGLAIWIFARRYAVSIWSTMDVCAAAVPIGLFFGRIANFINGELFGRVTTVPWGMVFPDAKHFYPAVEPAVRHPSQLYEAGLEGLLLFIVLRVMTHSFGALRQPGLVVGTFLAGYGLARATAEFFREPHFGHPLNFPPFSAAQIYCLPLIALGLYFVWRARTGRTA